MNCRYGRLTGSHLCGCRFSVTKDGAYARCPRKRIADADSLPFARSDPSTPSRMDISDWCSLSPAETGDRLNHYFRLGKLASPPTREDLARSPAFEVFNIQPPLRASLGGTFTRATLWGR